LENIIWNEHHYHNKQFLTGYNFYSVTFVTTVLTVLLLKLFYSWWSINVTLTHPLCPSTLEESLHSRMYCLHHLSRLKEGGSGGKLVWHALRMLYSVMPSSITFLHCTQYEQCAPVTTVWLTCFKIPITKRIENFKLISCIHQVLLTKLKILVWIS
jgi:hypothetical protein